MFHVIAHPDYDIVVPDGHRFSGGKFTSLMHHIIASGTIRKGRVSQPRPAEAEMLAAVHRPEYIRAIREGSLTRDQERTLGLPWSEKLARRSHLAVEGTYKTCIKAMAHGIACHAAGGTHHAHYDYGAGFCVFNDMAYAAMKMISEGSASRVLILDADVHQGDGTARILSGVDAAVTCSLHCGGNYPYEKALSDYDIVLPDGMDDDAYLKVMAKVLDDMHDAVRPDLVIYDAGVDTHRDDALGRLAMTTEGIRAREQMVLSFWHKRGVPVATVIGGGYTHHKNQMIALHAIVFEEAAAIMGAI